MLLIKCVTAYAAVLQLMQRDWDYETAHALIVLKGKLQPHTDFFTKEEMKLVEEFAVRNDKGDIAWNENGTFTFAQPERAKEYNERRAQLGSVEVQESFTALRVPKPASIKPVQLEALQGFIDFDGGGDA